MVRGRLTVPRRRRPHPWPPLPPTQELLRGREGGAEQREAGVRFAATVKRSEPFFSLAFQSVSRRPLSIGAVEMWHRPLEQRHTGVYLAPGAKKTP